MKSAKKALKKTFISDICFSKMKYTFHHSHQLILTVPCTKLDCKLLKLI